MKNKIINYSNSELLLTYKDLDEATKKVLTDRGDHLRYTVVKQKGLTVTSCVLENGLMLSGMAIYNKNRKKPEKKDRNKGLLIAGGRLEAVLKDHFKVKFNADTWGHVADSIRRTDDPKGRININKPTIAANMFEQLQNETLRRASLFGDWSAIK